MYPYRAFNLVPGPGPLFPDKLTLGWIYSIHILHKNILLHAWSVVFHHLASHAPFAGLKDFYCPEEAKAE